MARNSWSFRVSLDPRAFALGLVLACTFVAGVAPPAHAVRWDTYNNANPLNVGAADAGGRVVRIRSRPPPLRSGDRSLHARRQGAGQLASDAIADVAVDGQGRTWFAHPEKGVSVLTSQGAWRTLSAFDGLPGDTVTCLTPSRARHVGRHDAGPRAVQRASPVTAVWPDGVNPSPFSSDRIRGMAVTGDSTYVATNDGVYVTKLERGRHLERRAAGLFNVDVKSIAALRHASWCVSGGVIEHGGETGAWSLPSWGLGGASGVSLFAKNGVLLAGTTSGRVPLGRRVDVAARRRARVPVVGAARRSTTRRDFAAGNADGLWLLERLDVGPAHLVRPGRQLGPGHAARRLEALRVDARSRAGPL